MTKEISNNKTATDSSGDSPNYPENSSTESNYEKKTVFITINRHIFLAMKYQIFISDINHNTSNTISFNRFLFGLLV